MKINKFCIYTIDDGVKFFLMSQDFFNTLVFINFSISLYPRIINIERRFLFRSENEINNCKLQGRILNLQINIDILFIVLIFSSVETVIN